MFRRFLFLTVLVALALGGCMSPRDGQAGPYHDFVANADFTNYSTYAVADVSGLGGLTRDVGYDLQAHTREVLRQTFGARGYAEASDPEQADFLVDAFWSISTGIARSPVNGSGAFGEPSAREAAYRVKVEVRDAESSEVFWRASSVRELPRSQASRLRTQRVVEGIVRRFPEKPE